MNDDMPRSAGSGRARSAIVMACVLLPAIALVGWFGWLWHAGTHARTGAGVPGGIAAHDHDHGHGAGAHAGTAGHAALHDHEDAYMALRPEMRRAVAERLTRSGPEGDDGVEVDLGPRGTMTRLPPAHHPVTVGRVVDGKVVVGEVMHLPEGAADAVTTAPAGKGAMAAGNGAAGG